MTIQEILFFVFIAIFIVTAIITLLGITNVISSIKEKYLTALFAALILEVIGAILLTYNKIDFSCQTDGIITDLCSKTENIPDTLPLNKKVAHLGEIISKHKTLQDSVEKLDSDLKDCIIKKKDATDELKMIDKEFYSSVIKLRLLFDNFKGKSINLMYKQENKARVFELLKEILVDLGKINPKAEMTDNYLIQTYAQFLNAHVQDSSSLIIKDDKGEITNIYINEFSTILLMSEYLKQKYPIKETA